MKLSWKRLSRKNNQRVRANYCLCSIFFFLINNTRTQSNSEKNVYLIITKAIKKKSDSLFDSLMTLINPLMPSGYKKVTHT